MRLLVICLALVLGACSTVTVTDYPKVPVNTVVLLPVTALHEELNSALVDVEQALERRLAKEKFIVRRLSSETFQKLHPKALEVSGAVYDPDIGKFMPLNRQLYAKAMAQALYPEFKQQLILVPELVLRQANLDGLGAQWDEITRDIEVQNRQTKTDELPRQAKGLSLRTAAYANSGSRVYLRFAGLSLPYYIDYSEGSAKFMLKPVFFSPSELKESLNLTMETFLDKIEFSND